MPKTLIEPFRIKSVEPIRLIPPEARQAAMLKAGYDALRWLYRQRLRRPRDLRRFQLILCRRRQVTLPSLRKAQVR